MLIIGLSGRKQGGKNTAARHIWEAFPTLEIEEFSYAEALKQMCMDLFGLTYEQCYGTDEQKNSLTQVQWSDFQFALSDDRLWKCMHDLLPLYMTGRQVLQVFGTEVVRRIFSDAWVNATFSRIRRSRVDVALITDVRFPNEVTGIQNNGGKVIRLTRAPFTNDLHPSETALDESNYDWTQFDTVIDNREMTVEEQREPVVKQVELWL